MYVKSSTDELRKEMILMSAELVIMAAGMGSRFGGLKQAAPMGPNGEMIIDYSVYDAAKAGFDKAVIIIRKDIEKDFREACGKRVEKMIDVEYVFQEKDNLPGGYTLNPGREKPWGTGQAIWCARNAVKKPFLVINADDYYGQSVYKTMFDHLSTSNEMCMAGYELGKTLSENGTVTRGVCKTEDGYLVDIVETDGLTADAGYSLDTIVSMNMWGLDTGVFPFLEKKFIEFLSENVNEPKKEFYLPMAVGQRIKEEGKKVVVLPTSEQWYGVTYSQDTPAVQAAIAKLTDKGLYNRGGLI